MSKHRKECKAALLQFSELIMRLSVRSSYLFFRENNISHSQVIVLHMLARQGDIRVSDVSRALLVSGAAASQMLDQLVRAELVSRHEREGDRRMKSHELTRKGSRLLSEAARARQKWQNALLDALNENERREAGSVLTILAERLSALDELKGAGGPECIGGAHHA
jgi:DNA-binding MarR family transcriptional regulator